MFEGAAFPDVGPGLSPWYFILVTPSTYYQSYNIGGAPGIRAINMFDDSTVETARVQRDQRRDGPHAMTMHLRFMIPAANASDAAGIQFSDDLTDDANHGRVRWGWFNDGTMRLNRGIATWGPTSYSAPQNQWREIWMTLNSQASPQWKLWLWDDATSTWTVHSYGTLQSGGGVCYIGISGGAKGQMDIDFMRYTSAGAYAPDDPDRPVLPPYTNRIGEAKVNYCIGYPVDFQDKIVTNSYLAWNAKGQREDHLFIQDDDHIPEADRTAGIKIIKPVQDDSEKVPVGSRINVKGFLNVLAREAFVSADDVPIATPAPQQPVPPKPLYVVGRNVSAGKLGVQPPYSDTSYGLNNAGLRVRTFGIVTQSGIADPSTDLAMCYVDDGSGVINDSLDWYGQTFPGVKVYTSAALAVGARVGISGNAGVEESTFDNTLCYPVIFAALPEDVTVY
jgi:hypothetical protein